MNNLSHFGRFQATKQQKQLAHTARGSRGLKILRRPGSPTVTRIYTGDYMLDPARKEWEFGLLLVRMFRALDAIVADEASARAWLASKNSGLNGRPIDLITQTEGLVRVVHYLDASRAVV